MNSITSSAVVMPPMPMTGMSTAREASYTMRSAMGLMAGPLSPPTIFERRGLRVSASMAMPTNVLTREMTSAPASAAARAILAMLVTLGESFTISGRRDADFAVATISSSRTGSLPKAMPPRLVLGQETLSS